MTCFWDSLTQQIFTKATSELRCPPHCPVGLRAYWVQNQIPCAATFAGELQRYAQTGRHFSETKCVPTSSDVVIWQDIKIRKQLRREMYTSVTNYDLACINNGHNTGVCDPFLLLISEIFECNIIYTSPFAVSRYKYRLGSTIPDINLQSDLHHMQPA